MEKRKENIKKIVIGFILLIVVSLILISVQANSNIQASLTSSKEELKAGEEITLIFKMSQKNETENGINCYKGTLEYDKTIFEEVYQTNFVNQNAWEELKYNEETGEFIAIKKSIDTENEETVTITLKVKNNVTASKTNITIKDIVASEGKRDLEVTPVSKEINIIEDEIPEPGEKETITSEKYQITDNYITKVVPGTTVSEFKKNVTTNAEMTFVDKEGNYLTGTDILATGVVLKLGKNTEYIIIITGDIDGNGKITVTDLAQIKLHCIEKQILTGNALQAADINGDAEVTVTDLAQMKLILLEKMELE